VHHVWSQLAVQQRKNFGSRYTVTERLTFERKNVVKLSRRNITSLKPGPRIFVVIERVDRTDEIEWQAMISLIVIESVKGARQDDAPKIEKYSSQHA